MSRKDHMEMRACSLPPENLVMKNAGYYPSKENLNSKPVEHLYQKNPNCVSRMKPPCSVVDLGLGEEVYPVGSDYDPCSPGSIDAANGTNNKHSPSDCSSAFTDEDSGCHACYYGNVMRLTPRGRMSRANSVCTLDSQSAQPFNTKDEFKAAMAEDLADWLSRLYPEFARDLDPDNFFDRISDGVLLCHHATEVHRMMEQEFAETLAHGDRHLLGIQIGGVKPVLPPNPPIYQFRGPNVVSLAGGSFWARDNVANFIQWCRAMRLPDCILFETEDLVSRKNLRSVIVCLLEIARLGGKVGMEVPEIVYLEKEIDNEIASCERGFTSDCETNTTDLPSSCDWSGDTQDLLRNGSSDIVAGADEQCNVNLCLDSEEEATMISPSTGEGEPVLKISTPSISLDKRSNRAALLRERKIKAELDSQKRQETLQTKRREEAASAELKKPRYQRPVIDMRSLDEIVREKLAQCTCEQTFPMIRLSEGRYLFGDKSTQIFIRILRSHVMVRVGGGWDTLDHFLQKYDECRKASHNTSVTGEKRCQYKKTHFHSAEEASVDASNPSDLLNAVSDGKPAKVNGQTTVLGEGNLKVLKKGREVVLTTKEETYQSPTKLISNETCVPSIEPVTCQEVQLTPSSSIDDVYHVPTASRVVEISQASTIKKIEDTLPVNGLFVENTTEASQETAAQEVSSSIEDIQQVPIIDQVASVYNGKVEPSVIKAPEPDPKPVKPRPMLSALLSPSKSGPNSPNNKLSDTYGMGKQRAMSTNNPAIAGKRARQTNLSKYSQSTVALNRPSDFTTLKVAAEAARNRTNQVLPLSPRKRASSATNINVPASSPLYRLRPKADSTSSSDVFARLSANPKRTPAVPKIVTPPTSQVKRQLPQPVQPKGLQRRNSVATNVRVADRSIAAKPTLITTPSMIRDPKTAAKVTERSLTRRCSVARVPAEGSRIPRPVAMRTSASESRSKSVGSSLLQRRGSTT